MSQVTSALQTGMLSDDGTEVCAQFRVADCSRTTVLELDVHDRATAVNAPTDGR